MSSLDHSQAPSFSEFKEMIQVNIENAMILNSKLIGSKCLEIDSKIFHLLLPVTSNIKSIPNFSHFNQKKILGMSLKHMVNCCKEDLIKNPVFFSMIDIQTLDEIFLQRFEINETIPKEELEEYKKNYQRSIDLLVKLMDSKLSGLDFGKKFWNLSDL
jgi:hypothetical protein